jgi:hypothetical protein
MQDVSCGIQNANGYRRPHDMPCAVALQKCEATARIQLILREIKGARIGGCRQRAPSR